MKKFFDGNGIVPEIEKIITEAEDFLIIVSPYIKLNRKNLNVLGSLKEKPQTKVTLIYGKNEKDPSKSLSDYDLNAFKSLPNIEIYYMEELHAKYYGNQNGGLITSMNLYDYSQGNNIEIAYLVNEQDAYKYFCTLISRTNPKKIYESSKKVTITKKECKVDNRQGYCIRTGILIPFNIDRPMSADAFKIWSEYGDDTYPERFCHFSGEPSRGETCMRKPILQKNYKKALEKGLIK